MHESLARRQLHEVERLDLVRQVRELIGELLLDGGPTLEQVATRLQMPTRRLRERLSLAGVRFNDLVTDYRCRLAKELLLKTDERIEVIVERTGFSEPSTFYRAFKRWVAKPRWSSAVAARPPPGCPDLESQPSAAPRRAGSLRRPAGSARRPAIPGR